jgi:hypothetical protein
MQYVELIMDKIIDILIKWNYIFFICKHIIAI